MSNGQKKYTDEFKREAVRAMEQRGGRTIVEVAKELGLNPKQLYNWRDALRHKGELSGQVEQETQEAELKRLRRENRELRMEREILKKAALDSKGQCNASLKTSAGVLKPNVFRGRPLSSRAIFDRSVCV